MSDVEDYDENPHRPSDAVLEDDEDPEPPRRRHYDEDEEEEEDDDEEEEEEEDAGRPQSGRKHKKRKTKRKMGASRFLDVEAEVSEDDDEELDDEDFGHDGFIEEGLDGDEDTARTRVHHTRLERKFDDEDEKTAEQIAQDIRTRHGRTAVRYTGDMNDIPQRLLMPSVHDASLWQVRVKPGREKDIVFSLIRKAIGVEYTAKPLSILSAFQRDSLPGMIYVEARSAKQVSEACNGLVGVYLTRVQLVPIEEMASLLQIKKQEITVTPGTWVRIRRGKYQGDLAQVVDVTDTGDDIGLKFVPRIDLNPKDDAGLDSGMTKKRKKVAATTGAMRPPQRLFNIEEVVKVYGRNSVSKRGVTYVFMNDSYKDGFIEKDFKLSALSMDDVNPTLDEITQFTRGQDGIEGENAVDLSVIAEASRKAAIAVLQPGDHVEVFEGEQAGVHGTVEEVSGDVVTISAAGLDMEGQKIDLPARSVRKKFKPGDHVKVMTGKNADETGLVVAVSENIVTFLSDMSMQEVSVFSKDLREAAEVGSGTNVVGNYELHDLVQLDLQTVGVIFKTERDSFRVLDQNGQVRIVQPHQITMRRDSKHAIATDHDGHELRIEDNVKEVDGEGRKGQVLHIHQSFFAFLHNRELTENGGVFVTRARSLVSLAPKQSLIVPKTGSDLSKMNPALAMPAVSAAAMGSRGPRDRSIGTFVQVIRGPHKGYVGRIRDTNGNIARVELTTRNKLITIEKDKLMQKMDDGSVRELGSRPSGPPRGRGGGPAWGGSGGRTSNPYNSSGSATPAWGGGGGRTPAWGGGRTPNPGADSRTPAWNANSRTPNPYATADGGRTPAWNVHSKTPNPYGDSGRTPAWNASSTPNPYGANGGATPGRAAWGAGANAGWGGATPGRGWQSPTYEPSSTWAAPTPAAATSPEFFATTPGAYSAPTPAFGGVFDEMSAPTPAAAPTPGFFATNYMDINGELPDDWLTEPLFRHALNRIRVKIEGTRNTNYLEGKYEGQQGRLAAAMSAGTNIDQTCLVQFDSGEQRSMLGVHVFPLPPRDGDMALVVGVPRQGEVGRIRHDDGDISIDIGGDTYAVVSEEAVVHHAKKIFFVPAIIIPILAYARLACQVVIPRRGIYQTARLRPHRPHSTAVALLDDIDFGEFETTESPPSPSLLKNNVAAKWDWRRRNQVNSKKGALARRLGIPAQPLQPEDQWHAEALRYREHFLDLLEHERAQEEAVLRERLSTWSLRRLCEEGYAITDLSAYWVEKKRSQKTPKTISFQLGPGVVLPENRFENGTQVLISRFDPLREKPVRGSVVSKGTSHLRVGVEFDEFEPDGAWRIDVGGSASVYDRMAHAVKGLGNVPVTGGGDVNEDVICTGTHLADVLLAGFSQENSVPTSTSSPGIFRNDMRIASWAARYMRPKPLVMEGDPPLEGLNDTQRRAMAMMIGERFSLVQGPPGTGKTKTIIETVKLLKGHFAVPHPLLVCTYTNVAVDNLVEGLAAAKLKPLRVAYSGKSKPDLEEHTLEWKVAKHPLAPSTEAISKECDTLTNQVNDLRDFVRVFDDPQGKRKRRLLALERRLQHTIRRLYKQRQKMVQDVLDECDVVCTTCITSAANVLAVADFPVVFLDEASMSTEPASLIPFMKGSCHVSLIGDHKQLPPVITSPEAKALGLGVSLFERLIEEARVPSIMLDTQYRMHPAISAFPSLEFYDLGLRDGIGGQAPLNGMQQSVVFIDHAGPESVRDRSRVNWNEAHIIMNVIEDVLLSNSHLTGHDIGIIAPYAAQISLLNRLLNVDPQYAARFERTLGYQALQLRHIEVKTVDGFEGREKDVIIFSTVRNNSSGHIGFLADRGRLNVGLTRAKRGLFVVGSVDTLQRGKSGYDVEDDGGIKSWRSGGAESWRRYAGYCLKEGLVVKVKKNSLSDSLYGVRS